MENDRLGSKRQTPRVYIKDVRKPFDEAAIRELASEGISKTQIARNLGVSRMTIYGTLRNDSSED